MVPPVLGARGVATLIQDWVLMGGVGGGGGGSFGCEKGLGFRVYPDPKEPTFVWFLIMNSLYMSRKR